MVTCYVKQIVHKLKEVIKKELLMVSEITSEEKCAAKIMWLLNDQKCISETHSSQLRISLGAYKDSDGIIKLKGRLEYSDLDMNAKYPIFIHKNSRLEKLLISDAHSKVLHSGMKDTLNHLRTEYWLVQGR